MDEYIKSRGIDLNAPSKIDEYMADRGITFEVPAKEESKIDTYLEDRGISDLQVAESIKFDPNVVGDIPLKETELDTYAKIYGVDKEELRDYVGWKGGLTPLREEVPGEYDVGEDIKETAKSLVGKFGSTFAFGAPGFIAKKMNDDPKFRAAVDDLNRLISRKQSYVGDISEVLGGMGTAMGLGKKAATAIKAGGKIAKAYEPLSALGGAGAHGFFNAVEGEEAKTALQHGLFGLGLYGAGAATVRGIQKGVQAYKGRKVLDDVSPETNEIFDKVRREFEAERPKFDGFKQSMKTVEGAQTALENTAERSNAIRFMDFVNRNYRDLDVDFVRELNKNDLDPKQVMDQYSKSIREGRVTDEIVDAFLLRERLLEETVKRNADEIGRIHNATILDKDLQKAVQTENHLNQAKNPMGGFDNFLRSTQVFRKMDDKIGTDFELLVNKLYSGNARKSHWERSLLDSLENAKKLRYKNKLSIEEVYRRIEDPNAVDEVTEAYRNSFEKLLNASNKIGLDIKSKGRTYVPELRKSGVDLIETLGKQAKRLDIFNPNAELETRIGSIVKDRTDFIKREKGAPEFRDWLRAQNIDRKDIAFLVHEVENLTGRKIISVGDLQKGVRELKQPKSIRNALDNEVSALFERDNIRPPEWLMEKNVDKLFTYNVRQASRQAFFEPVARQFMARNTLLRSLGYEKEADYVFDYVRDVLELSRNNKYADMGRLRARTELWAREKGAPAVVAKEMVDLGIQGFYASVMGARLDNVVRNLTQTLTKAVPEFGWARGTKYLGSAVKDMAKDVVTGGWKKAVREAEELYHLKPKSPRPSDFEGIVEGVTSNMDNTTIRKARRFINRYAEVSMSLYMKSDEVNRVLTLNMAKKFVDDLSKKGLDASARRVVAEWPAALRREIDLAVGRGASKQELTKLIAGHLVPEAQVIYGQVGRSRFHRELGTFISTLSDYPAHMISDAQYKLQKGLWKGTARLMMNYFPSLVLFGIADSLVDNEDPKVKSIIGTRGFTGMHPAHSLLKAGDVYASPHAMNIMRLGEKLISAPSDASRAYALKKFGQNYTSLPGQLWRHSENITKPFEKKTGRGRKGRGARRE